MGFISEYNQIISKKEKIDDIIDDLIYNYKFNNQYKSKNKKPLEGYKKLTYNRIKKISFFIKKEKKILRKICTVIISIILLFSIIAYFGQSINPQFNIVSTVLADNDENNSFFSNITNYQLNNTNYENLSIYSFNETINNGTSSTTNNEPNLTNQTNNHIIINNTQTIINQDNFLEKDDFEYLIEKSDFNTNKKIIYQNIENSNEIISKRTLYSKKFSDLNGNYFERIGVGPIHYPDENGKLLDINTNFVLSNDLDYDYEVTTGFYKTKLKGFLDSHDLVEYSFDKTFFKVEIQDLLFSNENGETKLISIPNHVGGIVKGNRIIYQNAYGNGIDIEFLYHPQYFGKYLIINNLSTLNFDNNFSYMQFNFNMKLSESIEVFIDNKRLDQNTILTQEKVEFRDSDTNEVLFYFNEPNSIDNLENSYPISLSLKKIGNEIFISKLISLDWLLQSVYPVKADADTIYLESDIYDMYDDDGSNIDGDTDVQIGRSGDSHWDGYWAFPISGDIINGTINSVTFTGYVSQNDMATAPIMYGLQQENCPALEGTEDPSSYTRTTNSYTWNAINGGGSGTSYTTGDIDNIFNEWISDYSHNTPPDRFGIVLDDAGAWNSREVFFYDYSHGSYSDHTYLTIDYSPPPDTIAPTPDPMTWSTEPYETSSSSITMVATIASDDTPPISYYFNETTGNSGGTDSNWQSADYNYTDSGLSENTQYGYEVKARDNNATPNEGNYSTPISYEYTDVDPPTNEELTFASDVSWINATVTQPPNPTSGSTGSYFNWVTGGAANSGWQNGIYYHNRTSISENTKYGCQVRFRNGDADASNYNPSEKTVYTHCNPPTDGEFSIDSHGINWMNMSVAHPPNPSSDSTAAYFECVTGGTPDSGWISDSSAGRYYYNASGLSGGTTYGYRVKYRNGDGVETTYTSEKQDTTDVGVVAPSVVTNASTGVEETNATLNGWLQNNGTAETTCYFLWGTQNPPIDNNVSMGVVSDGIEFNYDTSGTGLLTKATLYYVQTKANNSEGWDESGGVQTFLTKPDPPTSLTAQANTSTMIYLTWSSGTGANNTYIERNTAASWARGAGIEIYNGSGTKYEDLLISDGTTYYYQAWSYANWTIDSSTLLQWSDTYDSAYNNTNALPTISAEIPANESTSISVLPQMSITVNDAEGDLMTITWYSNSSGSWQIFDTNNSVGNGTYYQINSNFSAFSTTYYWNVSVSTSTGTNDSDTFYFTTESLVTSVDTISPYIRGSSPLNITATGSPGLDQVTLYYRWSEDNQSWDSWDLLTYDSFEGAAFDWGNYSDGGYDCLEYTGGTYAHDGSNAANIQDNDGDASSFYHTSGINVDTPGYECIKVDFWFYSVGLSTGHDFFVEYFDGGSWQTVATYIADTDFVNGQFYHEIVWINESSYTFPSNMQIKFRCDAGNNNNDVYIDEIYVNATTQSAGRVGINWTTWIDSYNPDKSSPWSWDFNFPNSTGYYEFYSVGNKSGSPDESAPGGADTICYYNANPDETITVTPDSWNQGTLTIGTSNESTGFYFNLTNQGDVFINIQVKATNATNATTGAKWVLNTSQDFENYTLEYNRSDIGTWTNINLDYSTFITNLAAGSWQTFDLKLTTASSSIKGDPLSITLTFRSVAV